MNPTPKLISKSTYVVFMLKMFLLLSQQHGNTSNIISWFSLVLFEPNLDLQDSLSSVQKAEEILTPVFPFSSGGSYSICLFPLPYRNTHLGAKCSEVTPVEEIRVSGYKLPVTQAS